MCLSILPGGGEFGVVACTVIGVMDGKMNHCYYYETDKHFNAPQLICGQLAVWSQSRTFSLMLWKTSSRKCFPPVCSQ